MSNSTTFIHTSAENSETVHTPLIPIGLVALASFLQKNNIETQIINLELEKALDVRFDLLTYFKQSQRRIFCLNLHWHSQSAKVLQVTEKIKSAMPDSIIILGGFTASYFSKEIMESFKQIDFIIVGEAEEPLLKLVNEVQSGGRCFGQIPNLVWRNKNQIILNSEKYNTSQKIIDDLEFSNLDLIKNYEYYLKIDPWSRKDIFLTNNQPTFYYNCGRGCPVSCSYCGGSNISQKIINNRKEVLFINYDSVIRELKKIRYQYGIKFWHTCFDPFPSQDYYVELFKRIRKENIELSLGFECWGLPSQRFIDEFSNTFNLKYSKLQISPDSGSEFVRKQNKGYYYSNNDLLKTLEYIQQKNIYIGLFFSAGLAFEKKSDIEKTLKLMTVIRKKIKEIDIEAFCIEMDPCAPWFLDEKKYRINVKRKKFIDFCQASKRKPPLGYSTNEFSENDIEKTIALYKAYDRKLCNLYK